MESSAKLVDIVLWELGIGRLNVGIAGGDKNSHDHLLAAQQRVADELARAQSNGSVGVGHGCCLA